MSAPLFIRGGRLADPVAGREEPADVFIENGMLIDCPSAPPAGACVLNAEGLVVAPGFLDIHVHLREPGGEEAETIETGSRAAARGGFTAVVAMPNTQPPLDSVERIAWVIRRGREVGLTHVLPAGCITGRRSGREPAALRELAKAGAVAFTDDGSTVMSDMVMESAMREAAALGLPLLDHAQDSEAEKKGVMHLGCFSHVWKLPGIPSDAEVRVVERDIRLAEKTGCRLHIQHVSVADSVDRIADARARGLPITGEVTPHHLTLTDADVDPGQAFFKMNPPVRTEKDRQRLEDGLVEKALTVLATDHAPHSAAAKARGFRDAPFGVVGLETAIGVTYGALVGKGRMSLIDWIRLWTVGPAEVLGIPTPVLQPGSPADLTILNVQTPWTVRAEDFASKSGNSPFLGSILTGRADFTILRGRLAWAHPDAAGRIRADSPVDRINRA